MARPWPKRRLWPYVSKRGRKSYTVGFYDHDKRERSRSFPSTRHADAWMDAYITAERRGRESLRRFLFHIIGATPYALRRGGISLRLRAEDPQTVASECGTSLKMLSDHYAFAIEDLRRRGPRPLDVEWRAARATQMQRTSQMHISNPWDPHARNKLLGLLAVGRARISRTRNMSRQAR